MTAPALRPRDRGWMPYVLHLRPAEWPIMVVHMLVGWWLASGWHFPDRISWVAIFAWVVCLNGGTLALNSAFDHDEGDIAFLRDPPRAPPHLALAALALMMAGLLLTLHQPSTYRLLYVICFLLSILYSVPPMRFKRIAGMDWLINLVGFGALTAWAGWAITGRVLRAPEVAVIWAFAPLFAALYPLTQLYQMDEDRARGDDTLALRLGVTMSVSVALLCVAVAFGMLLMAGWRSGWPLNDYRRWGVLLLACAAWFVVLVPWRASARIWSSAEHQRAMYHALAAWALTDVAVILVWVIKPLAA